MSVNKTRAELYSELPRRTRTRLVREHILRSVETTPKIASPTAKQFGISRQAVNRQLDILVDMGMLTVAGERRGRTYQLAVRASKEERLAVSAELHEDEVWVEKFAPLVSDLPENVKRICNYGFTEMLNNVIDHSGSPLVILGLRLTATRLDLTVFDLGVGIFNKIQAACELETPRIAVFELTKGKFTTDPERHTGEGIFFTSRMFDSFAILSGSFYLAHDRRSRDWLLESRRDEKRTGTSVILQIDPRSTHTCEEVLTYYATEQDDYAFNRTTIAIDLAVSDGEQLVSRSQAKRVAARLDKFREVFLDFKNIATIGPAFADELFSVVRKQNPAVQLIPINANEEVTKMIRRAETAASDRLATEAGGAQDLK